MERKYRILIIDDENEFLSTYKEYFAKRGFLVDTATNGVDGFDKLYHEEFDIAIVDIRMPKSNGIEMVRKARNEGIDTSIIILTGHGGEEEAIEAINIGVDAWFAKSGIEMERLLEKVHELAEVIPLDKVRRILSAIPKED